MKRIIMLLLGTILNIQNPIAAPLDISNAPLFITETVAPLTMLVMARNHKLYLEAYNDVTDLNGDGNIDIGYVPSIDYYGYFDSHKCYSYASGLFSPASVTANKKCSGAWSGDFLNYLTTSRMDAIRKILYGGFRSTDSTSATVLERVYIPQDGHSWGKEYTSIAVDGYNISEYTPLAAPTGSNRHLFANTTLLNTTNPLLRIATNQPYRIWEWVSIERPVAGNRVLNGGSGPDISASITDYIVRVRVCDSTVGLEVNCRLYPNGQHKPIGILQEYGENESMKFGLITGSYSNNLQGGVVRKNISSITDEIDANTGQLTTVVGIIRTIDRLKTIGFGSSYYYYVNCGWIINRNLNNGECRMWGNPIGEMLYEGIRYYAGKSNPTSSFTYSGGDDATLGLPLPNWVNPYSTFRYCAKPNFLVISDINPNFDSNNIPGSFFASFSGDLSPALNANALASTIFSSEGLSSLLAFIGQSGSNNDGAPTAKTVTSFGNIRGLAPDEPNKQGSYYAASAAYYGRINDVNSVETKQNIYSYIIALSSPLPELKFNVGGRTVTIIPFAKSVGGSVSGNTIDPTQGVYQPTNAIIDYYVETFTSNSVTFRINFEDVQKGADYDMDAIVKYTITVNGNNTITVKLDSTYAAGSIIQHMGYVISGTTADGVYLEVRDFDTAAASDVNYFLDTPPPAPYPTPAPQTYSPPGLPLTATRTFTPSGTNAAILLKSPLWYAAKYGGFNDKNNNNLPDNQKEWDVDANGTPDNYFLVTNALSIKAMLERAIESILARNGSFSSAALSSGFLTSQTRIYQALFNTEDWAGQVLSFAIDVNTGQLLTNGTGPLGSLWDAGILLKTNNFNTGRKILSYKPSSGVGIPFRWPANAASPTTTELDLSQIAALNTSPQVGTNDGRGALRLNFLRGDKSNEEAQGGVFRNRSTPLGDIINSNPLLIGPPNFNYPIAWPGSAPENTTTYLAFKTANKNRISILYVGANDGTMHAFNATTGVELFAYVPSKVYSNLNQLTNPDYTHRYYVDGSPNSVDVFYSSAWHTVLAGGLNAGGQGIYALDITNPNNFLETYASSVVLWEFTDLNDADLGFTYSQPQIVRTTGGKWVAIFGNGYNNTVTDGNASTTGNAVLYIVDVETGALIKKLDTGVGMSADPLSLGRPNGMATPVVVDTNDDGVGDFVYAGDLFGNLWKIDITSTNSASWDFSFKTGTIPQPLFVAQDANGNRQPITTKPAVSRLKGSPSTFVVYFGTGKYIETSDKTDLSIQSVYSLRDNNTTVITGRSQLVQQTIVAEIGESRVVSNNLLANNDRGWYMDLIVGGVANGERVNSNVIFLNGKIIFATIIPSSDPCLFGGDGWLMELNALNGARLNYNVFDINGDGGFDSQDNVSYNDGGDTVSVPASGQKSKVGLIPSPSILNAGKKEYKYLPGTSGNIQTITENPGKQIYGRQSWRQVK
jgi:type IV pilus assembly protein PilY1